MKKMLFAVILGSSFVLAGCFGGGGYGPGGYGPMHGWGRMMSYGCGYGFGGFFMWILFLAAIGVAVYFFVQRSRSKGGELSRETPIEILKKRYAKGEISKEEFDRMKSDLQ